MSKERFNEMRCNGEALAKMQHLVSVRSSLSLVSLCFSPIYPALLIFLMNACFTGREMFAGLLVTFITHFMDFRYISATEGYFSLAVHTA